MRQAISPEPLDSALARVFLAEMERHSYTYDQVAERSGVSRTRVFRLLRGTSPFYVSDVHKLAAAFDLRETQVFRRAEEHVRLAEEMGGEL
ncbi:helix-turn-helix transcriptional regulator [Actinobaculum sp. 352]|uniref:helix-turn-helix domain-containing protein n=1 Tax=Actinobaculum sp. 352 TaxID=2490946 RepID=UPI000F7DAD50|nr:helix-turn-helix transcriptional regulator [Actinobaculum sp. 352]RTE49338.1 XRE family transcriptional regulator [Actinobaculum sp. 352]